jgi:hypothetical protein
MEEAGLLSGKTTKYNNKVSVNYLKTILTRNHIIRFMNEETDQ